MFKSSISKKYEFFWFFFIFIFVLNLINIERYQNKKILKRDGSIFNNNTGPILHLNSNSILSNDPIVDFILQYQFDFTTKQTTRSKYISKEMTILPS